MKLINLLTQISGLIGACEMYKQNDAKTNGEALKAEHVTYCSIKETMDRFKEELKQEEDLL